VPLTGAVKVAEIADVPPIRAAGAPGPLTSATEAP